NTNSIALDVGAGQMYWTDSIGHRIWHANLDGTDAESLIDTSTIAASTSPSGLAIDAAAGELYWTDFANTNRALYRAKLDGSTVVALASGVNAYSLALAHPDAGISVTHRTGLATSEIGGTDTFRVSLNTKPTANVTIPISSSDSTEGTVSTTL